MSGIEAGRSARVGEIPWLRPLSDVKQPASPPINVPVKPVKLAILGKRVKAKEAMAPTAYAAKQTTNR